MFCLYSVGSVSLNHAGRSPLQFLSAALQIWTQSISFVHQMDCSAPRHSNRASNESDSVAAGTQYDTRLRTRVAGAARSRGLVPAERDGRGRQMAASVTRCSL